MNQERRAFGRISSLYDRARMSYPIALIDDIVFYSGIEQNGVVLDVGCGTGQATLPLVQSGYTVIGLDTSPEMIEIAQKKCSSYPSASFRVASFEDVEFSDASIDIIASGMAWHWITPKIREEKAIRTLKSGGTLALFWSHQRREASDFVEAAGNILDKYGGANSGPAGSRVRRISDVIYAELRKNPSFTSVGMREYTEDFEFSKARYTDLVLSYGWVQTLSEHTQRDLVEDLDACLTNYQEPLRVPYKFVLVLAKKKS